MERFQLEYALAVAQYRNITRAAEALHIAQPSLSNQILHLEEELGVILFDRSHKGITLTEAGTVFIHEAGNIVNSMNRLKESMEDYGRCRIGRIRVGALAIMVLLDIPEMLEQFSEQYPGIDVMTHEKGSHELIELVKTNQLDTAFVILPPGLQDEKLTVLTLSESPYMVLLNEKHPLSIRKSLAIKDLSGMHFVFNDDRFNMQRQVMSRMDQAGLQYSVRMRSNQIETAFAMAEKNLAAGFVSEETAQFYASRFPHVRAVRIEDMPTRKISLIYTKNLRYHPALDSFVSFVTRFYKQENCS